MKKFPLLILSLLLVVPIILTACNDDDSDSYETYREWIKENSEWLKAKQNELDKDGDPLYAKVIPDYNKGTYILMRWFNDRSKTAGNLSPYWTSTVDVKYYGQLCNDEPFDSSYLSVSPADSIFRTQLSTVISGWGIALQQMHVGDSCEVIIPFEAAYGASGSGTVPPYSNLRFGIKLVDIPFYEIRK